MKIGRALIICKRCILKIHRELFSRNCRKGFSEEGVMTCKKIDAHICIVIITIVLRVNDYHLTSGYLVMLGGGLSTVPKIFPGETDEGTAGCDVPPSASPCALHPSPSFTSNATVGLIQIMVK